MDICWSKCDEQLVVSGGSNGDLYKLLVRESELVHPDNHIKYHDKTINKVNFHPTQNLLISGSQDGLIKLIDFRTPPKAVLTFHHIPDDKVNGLS
jgi:WD40 repeat protein